MFSNVVYVDKGTLERERLPELLIRSIAKGGTVAKLNDDWQEKMLTSVDDAFAENSPESKDADFFTSIIPEQDESSDAEISFLSWMKFGLVSSLKVPEKPEEKDPALGIEFEKYREDLKKYYAELERVVSSTLLSFLKENKNLRFNGSEIEKFRKAFDIQIRKGDFEKLAACCDAEFTINDIGFKHGGGFQYEHEKYYEVKDYVSSLITQCVQTLDKNTLSLLKGKNVGFYIDNVFAVISIAENGEYIINPCLYWIFVDYSVSSYCRISHDILTDTGNGSYPTNDYYYANTICSIGEYLAKSQLFEKYFSSDNTLLSIDYICFPSTCRIGRKEKGFCVESLLKNDEKKAGLPEMPLSKLTNSSEGLVDLYWNDSNKPDERYYYKYLLDKQYIARDPWELVKSDCQVSIDFGTSSTVVAVKDAYENVSLVRMGKYCEAVEEHQFENPTILNFVNYNSFMKAWRCLPYRPDTDFADLKFSHTAKAERDDHPRSCMSSIKTWARTDNKGYVLRLMDEYKHDFELKLPELSDKDDSVEQFAEKELNPIEVYAYLLGCCLNNQSLGNGSIYLNYKMTFPAKFDLETKKRIKQGFRNGLLRSLPPSLVYSEKWDNNKLKLEEYASEPIALAASFLNALGIQPTEEGVPFGVFDFGGGTTDFAMGIYRLSTEEEYEDHCWEQVLDIIDTSGDQNLGGEHLVNLMVHEIIRDNLPVILQNKIRFVLPPQLKEFSGSEQVWGNSLDAYENSMKLAKSLRSLWEKGVLLNDNDEQINDDRILTMLKNSFTGESIEVDLTIDQNKLRSQVMEKIRIGMKRFFAMVKNAVEVSDTRMSELHILFSGNSCRSPLTRSVLKEFQDNADFGFSDEKFKVVLHTEFIDFNLLNQNADVHYNNDEAYGEVDENSAEHIKELDDYVSKLKKLADNTPGLSPKTGVALGLLKIIPGESTGYVDRRITSIDNYQAPFSYYVGKIVRGKIEPTIERNFDYVNWRLLGKVNKNHVTKIAWTSDTLVDSNVSDIVKKIKLVEHKPEHEGWSIYIKPETPTSIKIALSKTGEIADLENEEIIPL